MMVGDSYSDLKFLLFCIVLELHLLLEEPLKNHRVFVAVIKGVGGFEVHGHGCLLRSEARYPVDESFQ